MRRIPLVLLILGSFACASQQAPSAAPPPVLANAIEPDLPPQPPPGPTADDAARFVAEAEAQLMGLSEAQQRAAWVQSTFITYDTVAGASYATQMLAHYRSENARADLLTAVGREDPVDQSVMDALATGRAHELLPLILRHYRLDGWNLDDLMTKWRGIVSR